jgi:hypothetical protein
MQSKQSNTFSSLGWEYNVLYLAIHLSGNCSKEHSLNKGVNKTNQKTSHKYVAVKFSKPYEVLVKVEKL